MHRNRIRIETILDIFRDWQMFENSAYKFPPEKLTKPETAWDKSERLTSCVTLSTRNAFLIPENGTMFLEPRAVNYKNRVGSQRNPRNLFDGTSGLPRNSTTVSANAPTKIIQRVMGRYDTRNVGSQISNSPRPRVSQKGTWKMICEKFCKKNDWF